MYRNKQKKGISTIIAAIFMVGIIIVGLNVMAWSLNLQNNFGRVLTERNTIETEQKAEKVELRDVKIDSDKFNMTLVNTGSLPVKLVSMWLTNTTDTNGWHKNYTLNNLINPGDSLTKFGQDLALTAKNSSSYKINIITERGSSANFQVLSPKDKAITMSLFAVPRSPLSGQNVTIMFGVTNNLTDGSIVQSVRPKLPLNWTKTEAASGTTNAIATLVEGPTPVVEQGLTLAETVFFKWVYKITGDQGDEIRFNATVVNAKQGNFVTDSVTLSIAQIATFAEQSLSAAQAGSLAPPGSSFVGNALNLLNGTASGVSPPGEPMHHNEPAKIGKENAAQITLNPTITSTNSRKWYTQPSAGAATIPAGEWRFWLCGYVDDQNKFLRLRTNVSEVTGTGTIVRNIVNNYLLDYGNDSFHQTNVKCKTQKNTGPNPGQQVISNGNRLRMDLYWDSSSTVAWFKLYYNASSIEGTKESKIEFKGGNVQNPFPGFSFTLDGKDFWVTVVNPGPTHFFITDDTRAVFRNISTNATYASMVIEANRTSTVQINEDRDVLLLQPNLAKELHFSTPATIPTRATGTGNEGTRPPAGTYDLNILLDGYDQGGAKVIKILYFGRVIIS